VRTDELVERVLDENPLVVFSLYTHVQARAVIALGEEIKALLEQSIKLREEDTGPMVDGQGFNRAYGLFWLWTLGAYEVVRTMCQPRTEACFSASAWAQLRALKREISQLRIPFAKQEYAGRNVPIGAENSVAGISSDRPDVTFLIEGRKFSARDMISSFERFFDSIKRNDILMDLRQAYKPSP
jgi:hypothetical protein